MEPDGVILDRQVYVRTRVFNVPVHHQSMPSDTGHHLHKEQIIQLGIIIKQQLGDRSLRVRRWHVPRDFVFILQDLPFDLIQLVLAPLFDIKSHGHHVLCWELNKELMISSPFDVAVDAS
jgi:hypothetical protein